MQDNKLFEEKFIETITEKETEKYSYGPFENCPYCGKVLDSNRKKKDRKFVIPRQISIFICCSLTEYSTTEIGNEFGGRDHTTIMHAREKVESLLKTDSSMNSTVNLLIRATKD